MGRHERIEIGDEDPLPDAFVDRCVAAWLRLGLPPEALGQAMFAGGLNLMLAAGEPQEIAGTLHAIAVEISPPEVAGHG